MFSWFTKQGKLDRIEIKLAGLKSALESERDTTRRTGYFYPSVLCDLRKEIAELEKKKEILNR